ncbi:MAG: DUF1810 domain-containing protein [Acidimicrobiales bacterium]
MREDPFDLERFVVAQDTGSTYDRVLRELSAGQKETHWMWFAFPQIAGLGHSPTAQRFAISSLEEARAFLDHPVLGRRIREWASIVAGHGGRSADEIFGPIDAMKLRSSMTLFMLADPGELVFAQVISQFFEGLPDAATEQLVRLPAPKKAP